MEEPSDWPRGFVLSPLSSLSPLHSLSAQDLQAERHVGIEVRKEVHCKKRKYELLGDFALAAGLFPSESVNTGVNSRKW